MILESVRLTPLLSSVNVTRKACDYMQHHQMAQPPAKGPLLHAMTGAARLGMPRGSMAFLGSSLKVVRVAVWQVMFTWAPR